MVLKVKFFTSPLDKTRFPEPFLESEPEFTELYWKAWEIAGDHVLETPGAPQTPYIDEALNPKKIWIWDTCFMAVYCRYAPHVFPGIESLSNFYAPLHDVVKSSLKIQHIDNPPLFAWVEREYFKLTGDVDRIKWLLLEKKYLQKHYDFIYNMKRFRRKKIGIVPTSAKRNELGYRWSGTPSGMDNTPRGRDKYQEILWMDLLSQQGLSAKKISELAKIIGSNGLILRFQKEYDKIKDLLNTYYWNNEDGVYYDINRKHPEQQVKVNTPATYWPMLAEMCDQNQAKKLAKNAQDPNIFGGNIPYPSVSRNDPDFHPQGLYWRGGVWLPMAYLATKALDTHGFYEISASNAYNLLKHMVKTYYEYEPNTIWEVYSPTEAKPATYKRNKDVYRPAFCGWSALGPVSMYIEDILGFHEINASSRTISWRLHQKEPHGIRRLRFANIKTAISYEDGIVKINSNNSFSIKINDIGFKVKEGSNQFEIEPVS